MHEVLLGSQGFARVGLRRCFTASGRRPKPLQPPAPSGGCSQPGSFQGWSARAPRRVTLRNSAGGIAGLAHWVSPHLLDSECPLQPGPQLRRLPPVRFLVGHQAQVTLPLPPGSCHGSRLPWEQPHQPQGTPWLLQDPAGLWPSGEALGALPTPSPLTHTPGSVSARISSRICSSLWGTCKYHQTPSHSVETWVFLEPG